MTLHHLLSASVRGPRFGQQKWLSRRWPGLPVALFFLTATLLQAQSDPWSNAATKLSGVFAGPIVRGFAIVCVVVGGLEFAFDTGGHGKRIVGAIVFGLGMALGAANFIAWLFS